MKNLINTIREKTDDYIEKKIIHLLKNQLPFEKKNNISQLDAILESVGSLEKSILKLNLVKAGLFNLSGALLPVKNLDKDIKGIIPQNYAYGEQTRIALDVANQYPGGDYFEFGSEGLNTLCNILVAFHLNGHERNFPSTRFFAFDIFGDPLTRSDHTETEKNYFHAHKRKTVFPTYFDEMKAKLKEYDLMSERVELIKGYFNETLTEEFKQRLKKENRKIGFAFLDCNIASSYKTALEFIKEFIQPQTAFIYLDEYFQNSEVPKIFNIFCDDIKHLYGHKSYFVRTAGSFGALFKLMNY